MLALQIQGVRTDITYLQHPIYVITGCALVLGIVESIMFKKKTDAALKAKFIQHSALRRRRGLNCDCERLRARAFKSVQSIEQDIIELFGIPQVS